MGTWIEIGEKTHIGCLRGFADVLAEVFEPPVMNATLYDDVFGPLRRGTMKHIYFDELNEADFAAVAGHLERLQTHIGSFAPNEEGQALLSSDLRRLIEAMKQDPRHPG